MADSATDPVSQLVALLTEAGARPLIRRGRSGASPLYDLQYRIVVSGCAFDIHATPMNNGVRRIRTGHLKLLQFVAMRPWLLDVIQDWSETRGDAQQAMFTSDRLRRGFLSDSMHDRVVDYLVAAGVFARASTGKHLLSGEQARTLTDLNAKTASNELFQTERQVLLALREIRITNDMLEGL